MSRYVNWTAGFFVAVALATAGCGRTASTDNPVVSTTKPIGSVSFVVEGAPEYNGPQVASISEGDTVLDVMRRLEIEGALKFTGDERGGRMKIEQIGSVKNEGGGPNAKNWIYRVNGQKGTTSCGEAKVGPNDTILWRFEEWNAE